MKHLSKYKLLTAAHLFLLLGSSVPLNAFEGTAGTLQDITVNVDFTPVLTALNTTEGHIITAINGIEGELTNPGNTIITTLEADLNTVETNITGAITTSQNAITGAITTSQNAITAAITNSQNTIITTLETDLGNIEQAILDGLGQTETNILNALNTDFEALTQQITEAERKILCELEKGDKVILHEICELKPTIECLHDQSKEILAGIRHVRDYMGTPCDSQETLFKLLERLKCVEKKSEPAVSLEILQQVKSLITTVGSTKVNGQSVPLSTVIGDPFSAQTSDPSVFGKLNNVLKQLAEIKNTESAENWLNQFQALGTAVSGVSSKVDGVSDKVDQVIQNQSQHSQQFNGIARMLMMMLGNANQDPSQIISIEQRLREILEKLGHPHTPHQTPSLPVSEPALLQEILKNIKTIAGGTSQLLSTTDPKNNPLVPVLGSFQDPDYTVAGYLEAIADSMSKVATGQSFQVLSQRVEAIEHTIKQQNQLLAQILTKLN